MKEDDKICGNCIMLADIEYEKTDKKFRGYCLIEDLYTFYDTDHPACSGFICKATKQTKK